METKEIVGLVAALGFGIALTIAGEKLVRKARKMRETAETEATPMFPVED